MQSTQAVTATILQQQLALNYQSKNELDSDPHTAENIQEKQIQVLENQNQV